MYLHCGVCVLTHMYLYMHLWMCIYIHTHISIMYVHITTTKKLTATQVFHMSKWFSFSEVRRDTSVDRNIVLYTALVHHLEGHLNLKAGSQEGEMG